MLITFEVVNYYSKIIIIIIIIITEKKGKSRWKIRSNCLK